MNEPKVRVVKLVQTCFACPSQWDGETDDGRKVYIRYRFGSGGVWVSEPGDTDEYAAVRGRHVAGWEADDEWDGFINEGDMKARTAYAIEWADATPTPGGERHG